MEIQTKFGRIGARARTGVVRPAQTWDRRRHRWGAPSQVRPVTIDVREDRRGEYFDIALREDVSVEALDVDKADRHLLLLARVDIEKPRFLCGLDERHWFVAAIPETTPVSTVEDAKLALRPNVLLRGRPSVRKQLAARRQATFIRQGEWFFVPAPWFEPRPVEPIRRNEPISRGGGSTPHVAAEAARSGGRVVYVPSIPARDRSPREIERLNERHGGGHPEVEMRRLARANPSWRWTSMLRDPELYVRGAIRHPDHAVVHLRGWHRVYMNTESLARAAAHVVFLD